LKILRQRPGARAGFLPAVGGGNLRDRGLALGSRVTRLADGRTTLELIQKEIIRQFAPACLVVDENRELLHVFGRAGEYLRHPDGATTQNVLHLTAHSIGPALGPALHRVERDGAEFVYDNVRFRLADGDRVARLRVRMLVPDGKAGRLFLAAIEEVQEPGSRAGSVEDFQADHAAARRIQELEQELGYARETLQATIEELETSNEELQASNEELLASNEELQSTNEELQSVNEELQSTNEELQSVNEELHSVNAEHQARIVDLVALSNDLGNIFASAHVGACLLDHDLRFRKLAAGVFPLTGLRPADVGAPVEVLARSLEAPGIVAMVQRVAATGAKEEMEVTTPHGALLLLRAVPFADESGARDGVVLTVADLTERIRTQRRLAASEEALRSILDAVPAHVALVDASGRILRTNAVWDRFARSNGGADLGCGEGANYFEACRQVTGSTAAEAQEVLASLMAVLRGSLPRYERRYACAGPDGCHWFLLSAERIQMPEPGLVISHARLLEAVPGS
jgi:two-component system CheB/CheR fusion protein